MSTLGLSGPPQKDEGIWKRLFWPSIHNAYDADSLGQQGFWVCVIVGLLTGVLLALTGHPALAALAFAFYFLGGMGLREGNILAAVLVFAIYLLDKIASIRMGAGGFGFLGLVVLAILLANLRGAMLVRRWKLNCSPADDEPAPVRLAETWRDQLCDQIPRRFWPVARFAFYALALLMIGLELLSVWAAWFGILGRSVSPG
ncbi:MAG TPA: hypothetical protein VMD92_06740 [Acidobacteriaceae bacterium]|jgi:hypothetical protein|nr:hypothetical protein [Acidobacteriaceae bacterium]